MDAGSFKVVQTLVPASGPGPQAQAARPGAQGHDAETVPEQPGPGSRERGASRSSGAVRGATGGVDEGRGVP